MKRLLFILIPASFLLFAGETADAPTARLEKELSEAREALRQTSQQIAKAKQTLLRQIDDSNAKIRQQETLAGTIRADIQKSRKETAEAARQLKSLQASQQQIHQQTDDYQTTLLLWKTPGTPELDLEKCKNLDGAVSSLRAFADEISANPSLLLRPRDAEPLPETK